MILAALVLVEPMLVVEVKGYLLSIPLPGGGLFLTLVFLIALVLLLLTVSNITSLINEANRIYELEKLALMGKFSPWVAHQIRNPLTSIKGYAQLLKQSSRSGKLEADSVEMAADVILKESRSIESLVKRLMLLRNTERTHRSVVDLDEVVQDLVEAYKGICRIRGIRLETVGVFKHVWADGEMIREAFRNICSNAVQSMPHGGRLTIRGIEEMGTVHLRFSDTGCGIPTSDLPRVFEPDFTTKSDGTGLGLPIARQIILAHGGDISISSVNRGSNRGTTVTVKLPALSREAGNSSEG